MQVFVTTFDDLPDPLPVVLGDMDGIGASMIMVCLCYG